MKLLLDTHTFIWWDDGKLPPALVRRMHRDPFDRMLVAQASVEDLAIISRDAALSAYKVPVLWD